MTAMADRITIVSAERVRDELIKLVSPPTRGSAWTCWCPPAWPTTCCPSCPRCGWSVDEHHRHKDVYEHSLTVLEQAIDLEPRLSVSELPDFVARFAALIHDIGKPKTRKFEDGGKVTFHHHDVVGAKLARKRMKALRFSNEQIDQVGKLVELHLRFHGYGTGEWTDSAVRRYVRDAGDLLEPAARAHPGRLHHPEQAQGGGAPGGVRRSGGADRAAAGAGGARRLRPDLDGNQIMEILGIGPGREVGEAYKFLMELRLDQGPLGEDARARNSSAGGPSAPRSPAPARYCRRPSLITSADGGARVRLVPLPVVIARDAGSAGSMELVR